MGGAHILVVDDDGFLGATVSHALEGQGCRITCAEDVPSALAALRAQAVDVVVADHVMPGLSGLALAAINHASVFRFIEKPCDPVAIRLAICCAADDLGRERGARRALAWMRGGPDGACVQFVA